MLSARINPLVRLLLFYMIGIFISNQLTLCIKVEDSICTFLILFSSTLLVSFKTQIPRVIIGSFLLLLSSYYGIINYQKFAHFDKQSFDSYMTELDPSKNEPFYIATVTKKNTKEKSTHLELSLKGIGLKKNIEQKSLMFDGYLIPPDSLNQIQIGTVLRFKSEIKPIKENLNTEGFDFKKYKFYQGISHQVFIKDYQIVGKDKSLFLQLNGLAASLQSYFLSVLKIYIIDKESYAIAAAMLLGSKKEMDKDLYAAFSDTGAVHVLAVSGLHVGIISYIIFWLTSFLPQSNRNFKLARLIICISCIWGFAMITGLASAVLRASIMFTLFLIGRTANRKTSFYNILAGTALIMLIYNPLYLFQIGFQFSFLAIWSIIFFQPRISKLFVLKSKLANYIWDLSSVSIAAQFLVTPLSIYYFNKFPTVFILSGIAAIPAAFLIITKSIILFTVYSLGIKGFILNACAVALNFILTSFKYIIFLIQEIPHSKIDFIRLELSMLIIIYSGLFCFIIFLSTKNRKALLSTFGFILIACICALSNKNQITHQKKLIVYHDKHETIFDIIDGNTVYHYQSNFINHYTKEMLKAHLIQNDINNAIFLKTGVDFQDAHLEYTQNMILFNEFLMIIATEDLNIETISNLKFDVLLINETIDPKELRIDFSNKVNTIIIDSTVDYYTYLQWKALLDQMNYPGTMHYTKMDGSFECKINDHEEFKRTSRIY